MCSVMFTQDVADISKIIWDRLKHTLNPNNQTEQSINFVFFDTKTKLFYFNNAVNKVYT